MDAIKTIGTAENKIFLKMPVYMVSGRVENFIISWLSHPATEKFLNQKQEVEIMKSTPYKITVPIIREIINAIMLTVPIGLE